MTLLDHCLIKYTCVICDEYLHINQYNPQQSSNGMFYLNIS